LEQSSLESVSCRALWVRDVIALTLPILHPAGTGVYIFQPGLEALAQERKRKEAAGATTTAAPKTPPAKQQ
jgi:hypothetical protein